MIMLYEFRKKFRNVRYWVGVVSTMIVLEHIFFLLEFSLIFLGLLLFL